jgi:hypothetical protein
MRKAIFLFASILVCAAVTPFNAASQANKLLAFGLITDTHVCDKQDQSRVISLNATPRYYTGGLSKIDAFVRAMNGAGVSFIAELGDFTDNPADGSLPPEKRRAAALGFARAAEAGFAGFKGPRYHVFGNHDTDQCTKADYLSVVTNTGISTPAGGAWYSFNAGGVHFIVLDASFKSDGTSYSGVPGTPGSGYTWDDANIPPAEMSWLTSDLAAAKMPAIVFTHQLLNPQEQVDPAFDPHHAIRNAAEVRAVLEKSGSVLAVFSGHYHDGGYQLVNGVHYVVLQASAAYGNDVSYHNQYATVEVGAEGKKYRVIVNGNGLQKTYVLDSTIR